ncbi:hypothetical protein HanIR_Chr13g0645821 [Helianthus annuus]|nr:hypothetical protein HanIR_Chr13g0645821 [Helianthus annuus]
MIMDRKIMSQQQGTFTFGGPEMLHLGYIIISRDHHTPSVIMISSSEINKQHHPSSSFHNPRRHHHSIFCFEFCPTSFTIIIDYPTSSEIC